MRKLIVPLVVVSAASLSACSYKGTTYGSGTTHEEQTLKGIYNMLSLKPEETARIEYDARPDLVMPSTKSVLPQPEQDAELANAETDWPVSPEEKLAALRDSAPQADIRTGYLPTEYQVSKKAAIASSAGSSRAVTRRQSAKSLGSGHELIESVRDEANGGGASAEVQKRREELAYSTGVERKFLTEPPTEYRIPSEDAEAGDLGVTKVEIDDRQRRLAKQKWATERGTILPGS